MLPAAGREGDPPGWPLLDQSDREVALWSALWAKPQALMWARLGQELEVALLVRNLAQVELPGAPVNLGTLVRQQQDSLGLTTPGLRANRWRILAAEPAKTQPAPSAGKVTPTRSARDRLELIAGGKGA